MTDYSLPMFSRLEPRTPFQGGRIVDTDVVNLTDAARFASVHARVELKPSDFLRAAGRGEITMRAIVHRTAKLQRIGGGIYCNAGQADENTAPKGSILNLPISACQQLAASGRAIWRTFDGFQRIDGILMRYEIAELTADEPDFETTTDDCRVTGYDVNALADAFIDQEETTQNTATIAPVIAIALGEAVKTESQRVPAAPNGIRENDSDRKAEREDARLEGFYALGGKVKKSKDGEPIFEGLKLLIQELANDYRNDPKTIRRDLKTAFAREERKKASGAVFNGLGGRNPS